MGVSAISSVAGAYAQNLKEVAAYQNTIPTRGIATARGYRLSPDDILRRAVISRLLCHTVIPKQEIEKEFSISFDEYFAPELEQLKESARRRTRDLWSPTRFASPPWAAFLSATWPWPSTAICANSKWISARYSPKLSSDLQ